MNSISEDASNTLQRRLAAVVVADVVGYSRLMRQDEEGTLNRMRLLRSELIDPIITQYSGKTIKLMGDGMLLEFASVANAVSATADIQDAMVRRNQDIAPDDQIVFRAGINLGDVIDSIPSSITLSYRCETRNPFQRY